MSSPVYPLDPENLSISFDTARAAAAPHAEGYQSAEPYNYFGVDNFLPEAVLDRVIKELGELPEAEESFDRAQERLKSSYNPERLPFYTKSLFHAFNARPFISFLEELTGIEGLIPDPYYIGAGIHKTLNGGHLDIHADFNLHKKMNLERRLNVLIYLNRDWKEEYGGCFEIWDKSMSNLVKRFEPTYNRMVCFSTGSDTFHGNPEPVNHPDGEPRQSIALYYYTATWDATRKSHTTLFKPRPGSGDKQDWAVTRQAIIADWMPPALRRGVARLRK